VNFGKQATELTKKLRLVGLIDVQP